MTDEDYVTQQALAMVRQQYAPLLEGCRIEDATFLSTTTGAGDADESLPTGRVSLRFYLPHFQCAVTTEVDVEDGQVLPPDTFSCGGKTYRSREMELAVHNLMEERDEYFREGHIPMKGVTVRNLHKTQATVTYPGPEIYNRGWTDTDRIPVTYNGAKRASVLEFDQNLNDTLRAMGTAFRKIAELGQAETAALVPTPITTKTTTVDTFQPWCCYRRVQPLSLQPGMDLNSYPVYVTATDPALLLHTTQDGTGLIALHVANQQNIDGKVIGDYVPADMVTAETAAKNLAKAILANAGRYETWRAALERHTTQPYALVTATKTPDNGSAYPEANLSTNGGVHHIDKYRRFNDVKTSKILEMAGTLESGVLKLCTSELGSDNTTKTHIVVFTDVAVAAANQAQMPLGVYLQSVVGEVTQQDLDQSDRRLPETKGADKCVHELVLAYRAVTTDECLRVFNDDEYYALCDHGVMVQGERVVFHLLDTLGAYGRSTSVSARHYMLPVETHPVSWLDTPSGMQDATAAVLSTGHGYLGYDKQAQKITRLPDRHAVVDWVAAHVGYGAANQEVLAGVDRTGFAKIAGTMLSSDLTLIFDASQDRFAVYTSSYGAGTLGSGLGAGGSNVKSGLTEDEVRVYLGSLGINALGQDTAIRKAKLTGKATVSMNVTSGASLSPPMSEISSDVTGALKNLATNTLIGTAGLGLLDWLGAMANKHADALNAGIPKGLPIRGVYQIAKTAADAIPYASARTASLFTAMASVLDGTVHGAGNLKDHGELAKTFRKVADVCADNAS